MNDIELLKKRLSETSEERQLNATIECFYNDKQELDKYKKSTDEYNKEIKEMMIQLDKNEYETDTGLIAKISIQNRESFDEEKLIQKLKDLNGYTAIKTVEVVDMDELEDLIYNGHIDAGQLTDCKQVKQVTTLKVSKKKGE